MEDHDGRTPGVTIVCSDCPRNGKTLFTKLAVDLLLLRHGETPLIFDTDAPDGDIIRQFPSHTKIIDLSRTAEQVALFDGILNAGQGQFVIDLAAHQFTRFFDIYVDIDFEAGAAELGFDNTVFFLIDRTAESIQAAASLRKRIPNTRFVPVRNQAIGDALDAPGMADLYHKMHCDREIMLPALSSETLGMIEHPDFHFDSFVAGHYGELPFEMKTELWDFLETLYEQRDSVDDGSTFAV